MHGKWVYEAIMVRGIFFGTRNCLKDECASPANFFIGGRTARLYVLYFLFFTLCLVDHSGNVPQRERERELPGCLGVLCSFGTPLFLFFFNRTPINELVIVFSLLFVFVFFPAIVVPVCTFVGTLELRRRYTTSAWRVLGSRHPFTWRTYG